MSTNIIKKIKDFKIINIMKKPTYMYLKDVKNSSSTFDATHKVAIYDDSKTSNEIPKWFDKFHKEEFKPLQEAVITLQNEPPKWFDKFYKEEFKPLQEAVIRLQNEPPKWFSEFATQVFARFDKIDSRINNLIIKNNLKE